MQNLTTRGGAQRAWRRVPEAATELICEWAAFEAIARVRGTVFPELGTLVGWPEIAMAVGSPSARVAQYRLSQHGWKLEGGGGRGPRVIVRAPCESCGEPHAPAELIARRCSTCTT